MNDRYTKPERNKRIPPPPGPEDGYDAIIEYFQKYNWNELEKAGYLQEPSAKELEDLAASATYQSLREQGVQLKLSRKDCERLARLAAKRDVPVETIVKRWIREGLASSSRKRQAVKGDRSARR